MNNEQLTINNDLSEKKASASGERQKVESADSLEASNLTQILADKSKHWKFGQRGAAQKCSLALVGLLALHSEEEIANVIDYAAEHPMYATGLRTVSKKQDPWDWFIERYDEIHAHMLDDADYGKRLAARVKKITKAAKAPTAGTHAAINPELHTGLDPTGKSWVEDATKI